MSNSLASCIFCKIIKGIFHHGEVAETGQQPT